MKAILGGGGGSQTKTGLSTNRSLPKAQLLTSPQQKSINQRISGQSCADLPPPITKDTTQVQSLASQALQLPSAAVQLSHRSLNSRPAFSNSMADSTNLHMQAIESLGAAFSEHSKRVTDQKSHLPKFNKQKPLCQTPRSDVFLSADIIAHKDNKALPLKNKLQKSFSTANFND